MLRAVSIIAFALFYLAYPTYDYLFDDLTYAMAVEAVAAGGNPAWLLHPHHLLFSPMIYLFYSLAGLLGVHVRALLVMQVASAVAASAGLWFFSEILLKLKFDRNASLAGLVLLGSTYNFWHMSTLGGNLVPACVAGLALFWFLMRDPKPMETGRYSVVAGLILAFGVLMHQTAGLFLPAACFIIWRKCPSGRGRACAAFVSVSVGAAALVYLTAGILVAGLGTPSELLGWLLGYFGKDTRTGYAVSYGSFQLVNLRSAANAWFESLFGYWPFPDRPAKLAWLAAAALALGLFLWCMVRAIFTRTRRTRSERHFLGGIVLFLSLHALFFSWWSPGMVKFWLLSLPAWCLLVMLGARVIARHRKLLGAFAWFLVILTEAIVFSAPALYEMRPSSNRFLAIAGKLAEEIPEEATVVISGVGEYTALKAYVPYFAGRKMLILDWQFSDKSIAPEAASAALLNRISSMAKVSPVYLLSEAVSPELDEHFREIHGVALERLRNSLKPKGLRPQESLAEGLDLYRL